MGCRTATTRIRWTIFKSVLLFPNKPSFASISGKVVNLNHDDNEFLPPLKNLLCKPDFWEGIFLGGTVSLGISHEKKCIFKKRRCFLCCRLVIWSPLKRGKVPWFRAHFPHQKKHVFQGIIGCTPTNVPLRPYGKSLYKALYSGHLWVIIYNHQESLENTIPLGSLLRVHPIVPGVFVWNPKPMSEELTMNFTGARPNSPIQKWPNSGKISPKNATKRYITIRWKSLQLSTGCLHSVYPPTQDASHRWRSIYTCFTFFKLAHVPSFFPSKGHTGSVVGHGQFVLRGLALRQLGAYR